MKNKIKKYIIAILILVFGMYVFNIILPVYAKNSSMKIEEIIYVETYVNKLLVLVIIIICIAFVVELFRCCVLYCGILSKQKGLPEAYKWFGLLLIVGIVILMFATPAQEQSKTGNSTVDELIKFKELYNKEIITEEEFLQKKKELLGK